MKIGKRLSGALLAALFVVGTASAARYEQLNIGELSINGTAVTSTATQLNQVPALIAGTGFTDVTVDNAEVRTNLTVGGKSTLNGELEVNAADVDINMSTNANIITVDQTAVAGTEGLPLAKITDARTGATADSAGEATIVIDAEGAYGLSVADGIVNIEGEIDSTGDITLDPAGNDVICDATVDATAYTADAGSGIDAKTAGALDIGNTTATSIDYGSASVTAHTLVTAAGGDSAVVLPLTSIGNGELASGIDSAKLLAGSAAAAVNGAGITNVTAANITPAGTLPQLDGSALTALDAGNITAATVLTAVDGSAVTNIDAANIAAGGTLPAVDGSAVTALDAANLTAGTVASAIDGAAITNITGANITPAGISVTNTAVTNFDITILNGRITAFTAN